MQRNLKMNEDVCMTFGFLCGRGVFVRMSQHSTHGTANQVSEYFITQRANGLLMNSILLNTHIFDLSRRICGEGDLRWFTLKEKNRDDSTVWGFWNQYSAHMKYLHTRAKTC